MPPLWRCPGGLHSHGILRPAKPPVLVFGQVFGQDDDFVVFVPFRLRPGFVIGNLLLPWFLLFILGIHGLKVLVQIPTE